MDNSYFRDKPLVKMNGEDWDMLVKSWGKKLVMEIYGKRPE